MTDSYFAKLAYIATVSSVDNFNELEAADAWQIRTALIWLYHRPSRQKRIFRDFHKKHNCIMFETLQIVEKMMFQALQPFVDSVNFRHLNQVKLCLGYLAAVLLEIQANIANNEAVLLDETQILSMVMKLTNIFRQWFWSFKEDDMIPSFPILKQSLFINEMIQQKKKFSIQSVQEMYS